MWKSATGDLFNIYTEVLAENITGLMSMVYFGRRNISEIQDDNETRSQKTGVGKYYRLKGVLLRFASTCFKETTTRGHNLSHIGLMRTRSPGATFVLNCSEVARL